MVLRQKELFKNIVEEYIKTAQPVGSKLIVERFNLDISPATVRNNMRELEEDGLIFSPHTSAGRIPTEKGYKIYITEYIDLNKELSLKELEEIEKFGNSASGGKEIKDIENKIKDLAKILAEKSGLGVFIGFAKNNVYYTGLSNIFSQPEFQDLNLIQNISEVIDHLDEVMEKIYDQTSETQIKIGSDNLFSSECSAIMAKFKNILIGIIGPMRMNYQYNIKLINFVKNII